MGKIALVFSGQGAQKSGMGKEIYDVSPAAKEVFRLFDSIRPGTSEQCFTGTDEELGITKNTQPCVFAVDYAAAKAVEELGIEISGCAGFSLGEIPALGFSGKLTPAEAFRLVCTRAELMEECTKAHPGRMAAVLRLPDEKVQEVCDSFREIYAVNFNCDGQVSCGGNADEMDAFLEAVKEAGGRAIPLAVSGAFHSPYMTAAAEGMAKALEGYTYQEGRMPIYANQTAEPYGDKNLTSEQVNHPVLWKKTIENMIRDGFDTFIEVGVGKTLSGLISKISKEVKVYRVEDNETLQALKEEFSC